MNRTPSIVFNAIGFITIGLMLTFQPSAEDVSSKANRSYQE
jgi:hypothetical protein